MITGTVIFLIAFQFGAGPLFFVIAGEAFPSFARAKLSGITFLMNWIPNIIVVLIFPLITDTGATWANYLICLVMCFGFGVILFGVMKETRGIDMKDMDTLYGEKAKEPEDVEAQEPEVKDVEIASEQ